MTYSKARSGTACAVLVALVRALCVAGWGFASFGVLAVGAHAQVSATVSGSEDNGFARLVFGFEETISHHKTIANGILVVTFDKSIDIDMSRIAPAIPKYLVAARLDPTGDSVRLALARPLTVNTIAAGNKIYLDLLPPNWAGPPPGLPQEVVIDLIRQAEAAAAGVAQMESEAAAERPNLVVRAGRYPTFSRIVFDWSDPTPTVLSRRDSVVSLAFERKAEPDLSRLNADPPPYLVRATARNGKNGLNIELEVEDGTDVRGFREGVTYIVDLAGPKSASVEDEGAQRVGLDTQSAIPDGATGVDRISIQADIAPENPTDAPAPASDSLVEVSVSPLEIDPDVMPDAGMKVDAPASDNLAEADEMVSQQPATTNRSGMEHGPEPAAVQSSLATDAGLSVTSPSEVVSTTDAMVISQDEGAPGGDTETIGGPSSGAPAMASGRRAVSATAKMVGSTLQLGFPFAGQVAAATFQRGNTLWVVFDTDAILEVSAIKKAAGEVISEVQVVRSASMQVVRLALTGPFLATATTRTHQWIVSIGDLMLDPTTPLTLGRALRSDGRSKVVVDLPQYGRVHWLADGEFADQLAVVTAFGPPRGLIKRQEFVEFTALATAHGLAIKPHSDDLAVRLVQGEVVVTRDAGLTISAGRWPAFLPGRDTAADGARPGYIDFEAWSQGGPANLRANVQRLVRTISEKSAEERVTLRLELARLYLAHELAAEAFGVMQIAESEDAWVAKDPVFRAMRGVANYMLGRLEQARADLAVQGLTQDPHAALWRGLVEFGDGRYREALLAINEGLVALDAYPIRQQVRFRLAGARSALEINDLALASRDLDAIANVDIGSRSVAGEALLLRAWLAQSLGASDAAAVGYKQAEASSAQRTSVEASFRGTELALREGRTRPVDAIDTLERLSVAWRGDGLELAILRRLSHLYRDRGDYRKALETMKSAVVNHDGDERARFISEDMTSLFDQIFLEGGADETSPVAALGLYYDFRELTPVGRRGDEMIRKLAHRLVEVDLLDQAAELLNHQTNNRLVGSAKAQVAADLSLIYLTAHQPENALRALRQSRQAVLPEDLQRKRGLLEVRALSELGRVELAIEVLSTMTGEDIERAKAEALWSGERWQEAGEQIERVLGSRWRDVEPLSKAERFDVMRAAIAYVFASDKLGLDRLRRKYALRMAESPDASAFKLVTHDIDPANVGFRDLAAEIAQVDTLDTFLEDFKARYGKDNAGDADS